jgi:hypothetical protein
MQAMEEDLRRLLWRRVMEALLEERIGDRTHGATLAECEQWANEVAEMRQYTAQLKAENERLRKIEDAVRLLVEDEGNPTDAWCLLLNALGGE